MAPESLILSKEDVIANTTPLFQYSPVNPGRQSKQIRLISLLPGEDKEIPRCRIKHANLAETPSYEALSYCWGDSTIKRLFLIEDPKNNLTKLYITQNLLFALRRLRKRKGERVLWVDAICINQEDDSEKNIQVAMMRDIYEKAQTTVIWAGEASNNSEVALSLIPHVNRAEELDRAEDIQFRNLWAMEGDRRGLPKAHEPIWHDLFKVLNRPWFSRAWIVQELAVSSLVKVCFGNTEADWNELVRAFQYLHNSGMGVTFGNGFMRLVALDMMRRRFQERKELEPMYILLLNRYALATDPRDHIFAFHGFFESGTLGHAITKPRYQVDCVELYKEAAVFFLSRHRNLDILSIFRVTEKSKTKALQGLPTWTPDWSAGDLAESMIWRQISPDFTTDQQPIYRASGDSSYNLTLDITRTRLKIEGWLIDEVYMTSELLPTYEHIDITDATKSAANMIQTLRIFLLSWEQVARGYDWWGKYPTGQVHADAFWQTLLGGCLYGNPEALRNSYFIWMRFMMPFRILQTLRLDKVWVITWSMWAVTSLVYVISEILGFTSFRSLVQVTSSESAFRQLATLMQLRRMMKTDEGLIGLAPTLVEPGDFVVLAKGGRSPLILRPKPKNGFFEVVGDCYIHGIMDGQLWQMLEGQMEPGGKIWDLYKAKSRRLEFWLM